MIAETIAKLRKSRGLTQTKLANAIHVTQGAVSQWETGRSLPDVQQMFILADFFSITVEELTNGIIPAPATHDLGHGETKTAPADARAEAKALLESLSDEKYQAAVEYLKFLQTRK